MKKKTGVTFPSAIKHILLNGFFQARKKRVLLLVDISKEIDGLYWSVRSTAALVTTVTTSSRHHQKMRWLCLHQTVNIKCWSLVFKGRPCEHQTTKTQLLTSFRIYMKLIIFYLFFWQLLVQESVSSAWQKMQTPVSLPKLSKLVHLSLAHLA